MAYLLSGVIGLASGWILAKITHSKHSKRFKWSLRLLVLLEGLAALIYITFQLK